MANRRSNPPAPKAGDKGSNGGDNGPSLLDD